MIEVSNVSKKFKIRTSYSFLNKSHTYVEALKSINFKISDGEIVGYIGPNGSGKSSTIKILSGILHPDSGKCLIDGIVPYENRIKHVRNIGVVFGQHSQFFGEVSVGDNFRLMKDIYDIEDTVYQKNLNSFYDVFEMDDMILRKTVYQLSLGQRVKCEIIASLLHDPKILFLDEPTIGLDINTKVLVRKLIKLLNQEKKIIVILTTHDMRDIEYIANRVILLGEGKILFDGSLDEIKKKYTKESNNIDQTIMSFYKDHNL